MKRTMLSVLILTALLAFLCGAAMAEHWAGSGTEADPWCISSAADLVALREYVLETENGTNGKYFLQMTDISLSTVCGKGKGDWSPIGVTEDEADSGVHTFGGIYNGDDYTISDLYINNGGGSIGLFGEVNKNGTIKNLTVTGSVKGTGDRVGGIIGYLYGKAENCCFRGTVTGKSTRVGGITGSGTPSSPGIYNCSFEGSVSGSGKHVGGIAGISKLTISNCVVTGNVTGSGEYVGGIAGYSTATISSCVVTGDIASPDIHVGGIVGYTTSFLATVSNCEVHGTVSGNSGTGGIVGEAFGSIRECKNYSNVEGCDCVGGITGVSNRPINACENYGNISGDTLVGGIAGRNYSYGTVDDCTNHGHVEGDGVIGGIVGHLDSQRILRGINHGNINGSDYAGSIAGFIGEIDGPSIYGRPLLLSSGPLLSECSNDGKVNDSAYSPSPSGGDHSFIVVLHPNGADGVTCINNYYFDEGSSYVIPENIYQKEGYVFRGWNSEWNGTGTAYIPDNEIIPSLIMAAPTYNMYAIWMQSENVHYSGGERQAWVLRDEFALMEAGNWYVVKGDITQSGRMLVSGDVNLILADGCKLHANEGITVSEGNSLTIWGQGMNTGVLEATGQENYAGIGSTNYNKAGSVTIHGGHVIANGGKNGAGIGGGSGYAGASITISGGSVEATGGERGAGIGGGSGGAGASITINGGSVHAAGGEHGAGIGGGEEGENGTVTINGGTVSAQGGSYGAGIGGGKSGNGGRVNISGGTVSAQGGKYGAGIGGGDEGMGSTVRINGGTVEARGEEGSAGIGGGDLAAGGMLEVYGGTVTAIGSVRSSTGQASPGIGAGRSKTDRESHDGGNCEIYGGTVTAIPGTETGAQAIGVCSADVSRGETAYIRIGKGMKVLQAGMAEPALYSEREDACRGGTVMISGCGPESHRNLGDSSCKYCTTLMGIGDYPFTFSGSTILIRNSEDWEIMARMINDAWYSPRSIRFALTNDITVSTMIGVKEAPFRAVFDGQGHTLTFECTTDETGAAPFRYVKNATFEHLRVAGTIITFGREAAGLANNVTESCTITDCVSSISIREVGTGILRGKHAGFVSRYSGATVTLTGCAFTGSISGRNADHCAGFLGAGDGTVHYCVYDGTMNTSGDSTDFIRDSTYGDNCYTFNSEGIDHVMGLLPFRVSAAEDVTVDFGGSTTYSVSGISACPNGIIRDGTFYAGEGQTLNLGLSACPEQGCVARYTVSAGELVRGFGTWLITMPAADVLISAEYIPIQGFGTPDLVLPRAVTAIEEEAFEGISAGTVYLHDGCREIGEHAFRNCGNLTKIRIPEGCVISADAFDGCTQVFIYGTALSTAEDYCETHANCIFVDETGNGE